MNTICLKCNTPNPLGRVFCGNCGAKLDQTNVEGRTRRSKPRFDWRLLGVWGGRLAAPLATVAVIMALLAFWSKDLFLPSSLTIPAANAVDRQIRTLVELRRGQSATVTLDQDDINAYYYHMRSKKLAIDGVQVTLLEGCIEVRVRKPARSLKIGSFLPHFSYDVLLVPYNGSIVPAKVACGHLPLIGPFKTSALRELRRLFVGGPEHELLKVTGKITVEPGKLNVTVEK